MPTITLPITVAQEAAFTASARECGLDLGAYVLSLLLKNENKRRGKRAPVSAAEAKAKAEVYARLDELREYERAMTAGEEVPKEAKQKMQPQPGALKRLAQSVQQIRDEVARSGLPEMTPDEIDAEIAAARRERHEREQACA